MLSPEQASAMFSLQKTMNTKVDPKWIQARYPYLRAVAIEGAEAIEHHGWKWWKKQDKDLAQLQMELIDIWHFLLSEFLLRHEGDEHKALLHLTDQLKAIKSHPNLNFDNQNIQVNSCDLIRKLELLIGTAIAGRIELSLFESIMTDCELTWTELYRQYIGKNVLNIFRQDNGYKKGSYKKIWRDKEDNEHLVEILTSLDPSSTDFKEQIYLSLKHAYQQ
ncbi:MAG: dUTP diphosphatase [Gammaproteobacteria bacterium]|nr:dUTP diphosphatase [Gammaproteobacteria bacterium]